LSYQGQIIDNFSIRFENGKAVEAKAEVGEELLNTMISMDEGAAYLGECALVPEKSPIAESGILFYNTLFDENAACHLALGMGYVDTIRDHHNKSLEECRQLGINDSMIHEDFMIGCATMNIAKVLRLIWMKNVLNIRTSLRLFCLTQCVTVSLPVANGSDRSWLWIFAVCVVVTGLIQFHLRPLLR
jgi:hypothetical protein